MAGLRELIAARQLALAPHFAKQGTTAWRILDEALGHPFRLEWYDGAAVAWEKAGTEGALDREAVCGALGIHASLVIVKERRRQSDRQHGGQYQVVARAGSERTVREYGLPFAVNLSDYLDTGLFVDHRALRRQAGAISDRRRVLNLFAYTGAFTVHAAAGGAAASLTVDMSNTYLRWAERNFALNDLGPQHRCLKADCRRWLNLPSRERYDLIVCDPPTFSNSKSMAQSWEVSRDQDWLLERLWSLLAPGGIALFSTNKHSFALTATLPPFTSIEEITASTCDADIVGTKPHRTWRMVR